MIQRAKLLIEFPSNLNSSQLQKELRNRGCKVESDAVFLQLSDFPIPETFMFREEKEKVKNE